MDINHLSQIEQAVTGIASEEASYRPPFEQDVERCVRAMAEAFKTEFPDVVLVCLTGDFVERARMQGDTWHVFTATRDRLAEAGVPMRRAITSAAAVWQGIGRSDKHGLVNMGVSPADGGPRHAVIRLPSTHVSDRLDEMHTVTDRLARCGAEPAGDAVSRADETVAAIVRIHHELGHVVRGAMVGPVPSNRRALWWDETFADVFAILATAQRYARWRDALADLVDFRSERVLLHADVEHWTVPALRQIGAELARDDGVLHGASLADLGQIAWRIADERAPRPGVLDLVRASICAGTPRHGLDRVAVLKSDRWLEAICAAYRQTRTERVDVREAFEPRRWIARAKALNGSNRHDLLEIGHAEREIAAIAEVSRVHWLSPADVADSAGFLGQMIVALGDPEIIPRVRRLVTTIYTAADMAQSAEAFYNSAGEALDELDEMAANASPLLTQARRNVHDIVEAAAPCRHASASTVAQDRAAAA